MDVWVLSYMHVNWPTLYFLESEWQLFRKHETKRYTNMYHTAEPVGTELVPMTCDACNIVIILQQKVATYSIRHELVSATCSRMSVQRRNGIKVLLVREIRSSNTITVALICGQWPSFFFYGHFPVKYSMWVIFITLILFTVNPHLWSKVTWP